MSKTKEKPHPIKFTIFPEPQEEKIDEPEEKGLLFKHPKHDQKVLDAERQKYK
jgi:hypothetical protein